MQPKQDITSYQVVKYGNIMWQMVTLPSLSQLHVWPAALSIACIYRLRAKITGEFFLSLLKFIQLHFRHYLLNVYFDTKYMTV